MAANEDERDKGTGKKKKAKATPKKERQISLRLSAKGAKRLNRLTEMTEWSVTQVIEEALKVYAAHEGITVDDKSEDKSEETSDAADSDSAGKEDRADSRNDRPAEVMEAEPKPIRLTA